MAVHNKTVEWNFIFHASTIAFLVVRVCRQICANFRKDDVHNGVIKVSSCLLLWMERDGMGRQNGVLGCVWMAVSGVREKCVCASTL